jgi:uncharacterized repeat protein (TIGR01451 family)
MDPIMATRPVKHGGRFALFVGAACLLLSGCFGITHNPSQVPHLFPFGDVIPTHARPPGFAYFTNFDRHACKLEVKPMDACAPVGVQQVFIATVLDADGKPRRNRRVEWLLEGPGSIVEVDESGFFPGRGYKVDNHYAVSYTDWLEHTINRGNDHAGDDFTILPGQSWCVLSSAVEGDSKLTVYAPEINNWDNRKVVVTSHWVDAAWRLPPAGVSRSGSPSVLTTEIFRHSDHKPLANFQVRYRIIDGPPAGFAPNRAQEALAITDPNGHASVSLMQQEPKPGVNRIAVEIVRAADPAAPAAAAIPIVKSETKIDWQAPQIGLSNNVPPAVPLGQDLAGTLVVANTGQVESQEVTLREAIPDGLQFVRSDPPAIVDGNQLVWTLAGLKGGGSHSIQVIYKTVRPGTVKTAALVTTRDGLHDERQAVTEVTVPRLDLKMTSSGPTALVGVPVQYQIIVSNPGTGSIGNVLLADEFDAGLEHETKAARIKKTLGTLGPGETRTESLTLTPRQSGQLVNRVTATADGGLTASAQQAIMAQRGQLKIELAGPKQRFANSSAAWQITVSNTGEMPLANIAVKDLLPPELTFMNATDGGQPSNTGEVAWGIPVLQPNERRVLELTTNCSKATAKALNVATASAEPGLHVQAESAIEINGLPAFRIDVRDTVDPVEVNGTTVYNIEVTNRGSMPGSKLEIVCTVPPQMKVINTRGPTQPVIEGGRVTFPALETLPPGEKITYGVAVQALQAGQVVFQAELKSAALREPVIAQESTTIIDPNQ